MALRRQVFSLCRSVSISVARPACLTPPPSLCRYLHHSTLFNLCFSLCPVASFSQQFRRGIIQSASSTSSQTQRTLARIHRTYARLTPPTRWSCYRHDVNITPCTYAPSLSHIHTSIPCKRPRFACNRCVCDSAAMYLNNTLFLIVIIVCLYIYIYICMCVYVRVYIYACVCAHICVGCVVLSYLQRFSRAFAP